MSSSEVARLREQIAREIQAMRAALDGYAVVSRHDLINRPYEQIGTSVEQLQQHIPIDEALQMVMDVFDQKSTWGE
jgi:hypothetical protein